MNHYSFYYGTDKNNPDNWMIFDLRTPAINIKHATTIFYFHMILMKSYRVTKLQNINFEAPSVDYIESFIRRAIEYDRVYKKYHGNTLCQYKKKRVYQTYEIVSRFRHG